MFHSSWCLCRRSLIAGGANIPAPRLGARLLKGSGFFFPSALLLPPNRAAIKGQLCSVPFLLRVKGAWLAAAVAAWGHATNVLGENQVEGEEGSLAVCALVVLDMVMIRQESGISGWVNTMTKHIFSLPKICQASFPSNSSAEPEGTCSFSGWCKMFLHPSNLSADPLELSLNVDSHSYAD